MSNEIRSWGRHIWGSLRNWARTHIITSRRVHILEQQVRHSDDAMMLATKDGTIYSDTLNPKAKSWLKSSREENNPLLPYDLKETAKRCLETERIETQITIFHIGNQRLIIKWELVPDLTTQEVVIYGSAGKGMRIEDRLTGLFNTNYLDELHEERRRSLTEDSNEAILMIDIDYFKVINDTFGHPFGDSVLTALGAVVRFALREYDKAIPLRVGGEEFMIILRNLPRSLEESREIVQSVGERIRSSFAALGELETLSPEVRSSIKRAVDQGQSFTLSIGVNIHPSNYPEERFRNYMGRADAALYYAKDQGRDRIVFCDEADQEFIEKRLAVTPFSRIYGELFDSSRFTNGSA